MRILISGSRKLTNKSYKAIATVIDEAVAVEKAFFGYDRLVIIHGAAKGVDSIVDQWAKINGVRVETYKAEWTTYGKAAGPIRNQKMLDLSEPDMVLAFPTKESIGTKDMIRRARKAGVPTKVTMMKEEKLNEKNN